MNIIRIALVGTVAVFLAGCTQSAGSREQAGTVLGAVVGGVVGSQFGGGVGGRVAGAVIGTAIGGFIGNRIGAALDEEDRQRLAAITRQTAATGSARQFRSARSGAVVRTRVTNTSRSPSGQACRTVEQEVVTRSGAVSRDSVTACRTSSGWVV